MEKLRSRKASKTEKALYNDLRKIKSALSNTADDVRSRAGSMVSDLLDDLQTKTSGIQEGVEDYVTHKPLKTLGIAILFGIFLGKVIL